MPQTDPAQTTADPLDQLNLLNAGYVADLYEQYRQDPASVDPEWRSMFDQGTGGFEPVQAPAAASNGDQRAAPAAPPTTDEAPPAAPRHRSRGSDPDQGAGREAGAEHDGQPGGSDRDELPGARRHDARGATQGAERPDRPTEGELHPPDRMGDREGGQRAALDEPLLHRRGWAAVPGRPRRHQPGPGGRRRASRREPLPRRPGHQGRRRHGLRRIPRPLRGARRGGAWRQARRRRHDRRDDHAHQPRDARDGRERAEADAEPGHDRRHRHDPKRRRRSADDDHVDLRPSDHPGCRVRPLPAPRRGAAERRGRLLRRCVRVSRRTGRRCHGRRAGAALRPRPRPRHLHWRPMERSTSSSRPSPPGWRS